AMPDRTGAARRRRFCAAAVVLLLPACSLIGPDAEQVRVCRMAVPALEPAGTRIALSGARRGEEPNTVRLDYRASLSGGGGADRFVLCRFLAEGLSPNKADLAGVRTDRGEIAPATVYLLKRYYLDTPEALASDPGPGDPTENLPRMPAPAAYAAEQVLVALPRIAIYGLLAAAYALVFGLVGRVNLAFGEIAAVGAAAAGLSVAAAVAAGASSPASGLALAIVVALGAAALHGTVAGTATFGLVSPRRTQASLIATIGASIAISEYLRLAGGRVPDWIAPVWNEPWRLARAGEFVVTLTPVSVLTSSLGLAAALALVVLMRRSGYGRAWRALSDDPEAASLFGIDPRRIARLTFGLAGGLAGLSGALVAIQFGALGFAGGFQLGLKALAAAVLGGVGSLGGAFVGGLAIGLFETLWSAYLPIQGRDLALHAALILVIVLKPDGLFGVPEPLSAPR
ncbi:MAG: hypothetical protein JWQ36_2600, partial [Enterovirga sp.]|nr:hypothetical protein [Enterovirga sp.]